MPRGKNFHHIWIIIWDHYSSGSHSLATNSRVNFNWKSREANQKSRVIHLFLCNQSQQTSTNQVSRLHHKPESKINRKIFFSITHTRILVSPKITKMKTRQVSYIILAIVLSLSLITQRIHCGPHDELAKKFVKLLIAAALLSPPGFGFAPIPLPLPIPVKINVNHEPIIGPPIPNPFLHGGFAGHHLGGIGALGGHGFGRKRRRWML